MRAGWKGLPILYQRCYISVMGWGGEGITGAMEVETHPPHLRPANVPFCSKSFLILCFFFFSCGWGLVNFLKVLFNVGERVPAPDRVTCSPPSLHPPRRLSPPQASLLSLPTSPSSETLSSATSHPHGLSLSLFCVLSHWVSEHNFPKHKAVFPPRGGRKQETLYLFCMCIII